MERTDDRVATEAYVLLALGSLAYFLYMFAWFSVPAYLGPIIEDLGLSNTQAGVVVGAVQLSYVPLSLVSGLVIDRLGSRAALAVGVAVVGVAQVLRGLSTGFVALLLPTLLLGVGGTAVTFGLPKLVSELFPADRSGTLSSVYIVGATLGTATVFGVARPVLGPATGGWRPFLVATGSLVVGFALCWTVASRYLWRRVDDFSAATDEPRQVFTLGSARRDLANVLTHRGLGLLVVIGTMRLFVTHGLSAWLPTILEARGLAEGLAATVTSLFVVVRIVGILAVPAVSDRFSVRRAPIVGCGVAGVVGMLGLLLGSSLAVVLASLVLVGVFLIGGLAPLVRAIPIELRDIGPRLTAVATGLVYTIGEIGGFLGPFLVGTSRDLTGSFAPGLGLFVCAAGVTALAGYLMAEPRGASTASGGD